MRRSVGAASRCLVFRGDVALHGRRISADAARLASQKLHDRLLFATAAQVPQRRIEPGECPAPVGTGELVLLLLDPLHEAENVVGPLPQRMWRNLTVEDLSGDIGIIGGALPPSDGAIIRRRADKTDKLVREGLETRDLGHQEQLSNGLGILFGIPGPVATGDDYGALLNGDETRSDAHIDKCDIICADR